MTDDEWLTRFSKSREQILGRVKGLYLPSIQGTQSFEKYLVLRERSPGRTKNPPVREPGTDGNQAPFGQAQNYGSSANSQEIPVSKDNIRPEGTEDQSVTSPSG